MRKTKITTMCECAVLLALSIALSFIALYKAPLGGSVTLLSMLPIMMVGTRHGLKWGLGTCFLYSLFQIMQALMEGNVFPYCIGLTTILICAAFDYLIPFTALGLTGLTHKKDGSVKTVGTLITIALLLVFRFCCHFVTGVVIWGQWAPEGMGKFLYSFLYNGGFLSLDFAICIVCAVLMMRSSEIRRLVGMPVRKH
jgi:thiamine transporter